MSSNYNIYNNLVTSGCKIIKSAESNGSGTIEDIPFGFCVINGLKGTGNEIIYIFITNFKNIFMY